MFVALLKKPKVEHASVCLWMNVVLAYNGILFSFKKEGGPDTCSNTDGLRDIMLSEISQPQKDKDYKVLLL